MGDDYRVLINLNQNDTFNDEGIYIKVMKKAAEEMNPDLIQYHTELDEFVTPFSIKNNNKSESTLSLTEVIGPLKLNKFEYDVSENTNNHDNSQFYIPNDNTKSVIETTVSRGYCLNIPQVGYLLVTHNADVILRVYENDEKPSTNKSIYIETPGQVILNTTNASYLDLDITSSATVLSGKCNACLGKLNFRPFSNNNLINCVFVDNESLLSVSHLNMTNSILMVLGELSIRDEMHFKCGSFFNMGRIVFFRTTFNEINASYFFNGSKGNFKSYNIDINTQCFSNIGIFEVQNGTINTSKAFDNQKTINVTKKLEIKGESEAINRGDITSKNGVVQISNPSFLHKIGIIDTNKLIICSQKSLIESSIRGKKAIFYNSTKNKKRVIEKKDQDLSLNLQDVVINGLFINEDLMKVNQSLQLEGEQSLIQNKGEIITGEIVSNSENGLVVGGEVIANSFKVNDYLQTQCSFRNLDYIEVSLNGKLFISKENDISSLRRISNKGLIKILAGMPKLSEIENDKSGHIEIETDCRFNNIKSLSKMNGKLDIKNAKIYSIEVLELPSGASMHLLEGTKMDNVKKLIVKEKASLILEKDTINRQFLKEIINFGIIDSYIPLFNLKSIYNGPNANLNLYNEVKVLGRRLTTEDSKLINVGKYTQIIQDAFKKSNKKDSDRIDIESKFGVFNEGSIRIKFLSKAKDTPNSFFGDVGSFLQCVPSNPNDPQFKNMKRKGMIISDHFPYVASEKAKVILEDFTMLCSKEIINKGVIYSPMKLRIDQINDITYLGTVGCEDGIDLNIIDSPFYLNGEFNVVIQGTNKKLNIYSNNIINISYDNNLNVDLNIQANNIICEGNLIVNSLNSKSDEFYIKKGENRNRNSISALQNFIIYTNWFMNHSGTLQTKGLKPSKLVVSELFQNTGGGEFSNKTNSKITWFTMNYDRRNNPRFDQAGLITTGGSLEIIVGSFDNCFGTINGGEGLTIDSSKALNIECGLIYSGGETVIKNDEENQNGYLQVKKEFEGTDLNASKYGQLPEYFIMRPRNGYVIYDKNDPNKTLMCFEMVYKESNNSLNQGYIFSVGDLDIRMNKSCYLGTIVSENDIYFKGIRQIHRFKNDMGTFIAKGSIEIEIANAKIENLNIQARNILLKIVEDFTNKGIIKNACLENGVSMSIVDLSKLATYLGFTTKSNTYRKQGDISNLLLKRISLSPLQQQTNEISLFTTNDSGFFSMKPKSEVFVSSIQNSVLNKLIRLTLAPLEGRDILLRVDLINELRKIGSKYTDSVTNTRQIVLKNGEPGIIFHELKDQEIEMEIDGEKVLVPLCNPYLIVNTVSRMMSMIKAEKSITLHTKGNIDIGPGDINLDAPNLSLEAESRVTIASEYKYTGHRKTGVNIASIKVPENLTISGDKGVDTQGADLSGRRLIIRSKNGDIIDYDMPLDMTFQYDMPFHDWWTIKGHKDTHTTRYQGIDYLELSAPNGTIKQTGTNSFAGKDGVLIEGKYLYKPSYQEDLIIEQRKRRSTRIEIRTPKQGGIISTGKVIFKTSDATLMGATIIAPKISNPTDGSFKLLPSYIDQHIWSRETKKNFWGSSSVEFDQYRHIPVGCKIITEEFEFLGSGTLEMEGVTANIINANITKNLIERAAYETNHTVITQKSSGFCPPKINGDCFIESIKNSTNKITCFQDAASSAFNLMSGFFKTAKDLDVLRDLSNHQNPMLSIAQIFLSRFVTSFSFSNIKTVTTIDEKIPHQSQINIEVLRVSNDRTHLEGNLNIKGKAIIDTKEFTTKAPEHTFHQHTETSGYCISLSPAAVFAASLAPCQAAFVNCLPSISVFNSETDIKGKDHIAQVLTADDLFIRCDKAVFSGSTIQARLIEAIVSGDLTIEDLQSEFSSTTTSSNFGVSLSGIFNLVDSMTPMSQSLEQLRNQVKNAAIQNGELNPELLADKSFLDPRLQAIPQIRIANESEIKKQVQNLSSMVGREKFYLKVAGLLHKKSALIGLAPPDGVVANSENEKIEAGRILDEKIAECHQHEKHVFNPCVSEFIGMMSSYQSWQQAKEDIELREYNKALNEGKCSRDAKMDAKLKSKQIMNAIENLNEDGLKVLLLAIKLQSFQKQNEANKSQPNQQTKNTQNQQQQQQQQKTTKSQKSAKNSQQQSDSSQQKVDTSKQPSSQNIQSQKDKAQDQRNEQKEKIENGMNEMLNLNSLSKDQRMDFAELILSLYGNQNEISPFSYSKFKKILQNVASSDSDSNSNSNSTPETKKEYHGYKYVLNELAKKIISTKNFVYQNPKLIENIQNTITTLLYATILLTGGTSALLKTALNDLAVNVLSGGIDKACEVIMEKIPDDDELQRNMVTAFRDLKDLTLLCLNIVPGTKNIGKNICKIANSGKIKLNPANDNFYNPLTNYKNIKLNPVNDNFNNLPPNDGNIKLNPVNDNINLKSVLDDNSFYKMNVETKINTENPLYESTMQNSAQSKNPVDLNSLLNMPNLGSAKPQAEFKPYPFSFDKININFTFDKSNTNK